MKLPTRLVSILAAASLVLGVAAFAQNGGGDRQRWALKAKILTGQTCEEDKSLPADEQKCATLVEGASFTTVSTLEARRKNASDIRVDFCGKFEDAGSNAASCQAVIDGAVADPGDQTMAPEDSGMIPVTDYVSCFSWFGAAAGRGPGTPSSIVVEIQCKNDGKGDGTDVFLSKFTSSVFSQ